MTTRKHQHRVRDFVLYILISFAVVAVVLICARTGFAKGWSQWIGLAFLTSLLFYYWLKICKTLWRRGSFWFITSVFLLSHLGAWTIMLRRFDSDKPLGYLAFAAVPELLLFAWCADLLDTLFGPKDTFEGASRP
jgi:hypothetical protein